MLNSLYRSIIRRATPEVVVLSGILGISVYMFIDAITFTYEARLFPQFAAAVTIFGSVLLLLRNQLPHSLQKIISESSGMFDQYEEQLSEPDDSVGLENEDTNQTDLQKTSDTNKKAQRKQIILVGLVAGYGLIGYIIGLVWATPIFVLVFSAVFGLPRNRSIILVVISLIIAVIFNAILPVDMAEGLIGI